MPQQTTKLKLYKFLADDFVDFDLLNQNTDALENMSLCVKSETSSVNVSGLAGSGTWHTKKYADDTIEMSAIIDFGQAQCTTQESGKGVYTTNEAVLMLPYALKSIYSVHMDYQSNGSYGFIQNDSDRTVLTQLKFKFVSITSESSVSKRAFITVRGEFNGNLNG